jgi:hypothetical protein
MVERDAKLLLKELRIFKDGSELVDSLLGSVSTSLDTLSKFDFLDNLLESQALE